MTQVITHNVTERVTPKLHFTRDEYLKIDKQTSIKNRQTDEYLKIDNSYIKMEYINYLNKRQKMAVSVRLY